MKLNRSKRIWHGCIMLFLFICVSITWTLYRHRKEGYEDAPHGSIEYYVISMNDAVRAQNIKDQQTKIKSTIHIFDAIHGDTLDINNIRDQIVADSFKEESSKRKREIGCFLSHYYLYKKIQEEGDLDGYTVIFEDDFEISTDNFEYGVKQALDDMTNHDYDLLFINNVANNMGNPVSENVCEMNKAEEMYGTQSYIVKNRNINRILEQTYRIDTQIDHKLFNSYRNGKLKIYTFCPFLTKTRNFKSTIGL